VDTVFFRPFAVAVLWLGGLVKELLGVVTAEDEITEVVFAVLSLIFPSLLDVGGPERDGLLPRTED
jgi:hypothetical protein